MQRFVCAADGQRSPEKMASLYWAWFRADGARTAWKQRLCAMHTEERLSALLAHSKDQSDSLFLCPSCGTSSESDLDPIYLTLYAPHTEALRFELPTCASCAVRLRIAAQERAEKLPDRNNGQSNGGESEKPDGWGWLA